MHKNRIILLLIVFSILLLSFTFNTNATAREYNYNEIRIVKDGEFLKTDVNPIIIEGRTLLPFRAISEKMGIDVVWDKATQTVTAKRDNINVKLEIDSNLAIVNGVQVELDVPANIVNGRTLIPVRFFVENFNANVLWNEKTKVVSIDTGKSNKKHVMGFYYSASYGDFTRNYNHLSSIANKWYTIDSNYRLTSRDMSRSIFVPEGYEKVLDLSKKEGIHRYALVFEDNSQKLHNLLSSENNRKSLINDLTQMVLSEDYDGLNIDFEFIRGSDREYFNRFIKELYVEMQKIDKTLSISLHSKTERADWFKGYDYSTLGEHSDFVVLMTYDKDPSRPGPQAPIGWVEDVVDYTLRRIPPEKVILGIGVYGYGWTDDNRRGTWLLSRDEMTFRVRFIDETIEKYNINPSWDESAQMPYFVFTGEDGMKREVWYENEISIKQKIDLANRKNLKGIAFWRLGYIPDSVWNMLYETIVPIKY